MLSAALASSGAVMLSTGLESRGIEPVVTERSGREVEEQPASTLAAISRQMPPKNSHPVASVHPMMRRSVPNNHVLVPAAVAFARHAMVKSGATSIPAIILLTLTEC